MCCFARKATRMHHGNMHILLQMLLARAGLACRLSIGSSRCVAQPETAVSWPPAQRALPPELWTAGAKKDLLTVN